MLSRITIIFAFVLMLALLNKAKAQSTATTTTTGNVQPVQLIHCNEATGLQATDSIISGTWYAIAASPPATFMDISCPEVKVSERYNSTLIVANVALSNTPNSAHMNRSLTAVATTDTGNFAYGYNFTFQSFTGQTSAVTLKLLSTSNGFTFVCGYSNYSDTSSSFGIALFSAQNFNETLLQQLQAASRYSNFANNLQLIPQSNCYISSGTRTLPVAFGGLLLIYTLLNYLRN